jgi:hypothetical protein
MIFAVMAAALAAANIMAIWYKGCSDVFPCAGGNVTVASLSSATSGGGVDCYGNSSSSTTGPTAEDYNAEVKKFFAVSFSLNAAGAVALLALRVSRRSPAALAGSAAVKFSQ